MGPIERPSVPVEVPLPLGRAPSPVSLGTKTPFVLAGAGGGRPPSGATGAAARGGGALDAVDPQAPAIADSKSTPASRTTRRSEDMPAV